jgi:hypothetical protein
MGEFVADFFDFAGVGGGDEEFVGHIFVSSCRWMR